MFKTVDHHEIKKRRVYYLVVTHKYGDFTKPSTFVVVKAVCTVIGPCFCDFKLDKKIPDWFGKRINTIRVEAPYDYSTFAYKSKNSAIKRTIKLLKEKRNHDKLKVDSLDKDIKTYERRARLLQKDLR